MSDFVFYFFGVKFGSGFTVKVVASENFVTRDSGLMLWDIAVGQGECPKAGQQVSNSFT